MLQCEPHPPLGLAVPPVPPAVLSNGVGDRSGDRAPPHARARCTPDGPGGAAIVGIQQLPPGRVRVVDFLRVCSQPPEPLYLHRAVLRLVIARRIDVCDPPG